jgi:xanthine dehydrogenase accessory factor
MHELEKIAAAVQRIVEQGRRGLLVTVIATRGSTYRRAGARCVIGDDGAVTGAISGGCVERDLAERARTWGEDTTARVVAYDSSSADDIVFGLGLGCRGKIDMLVQPFDRAHPPRLPEIPQRRSIEFTTVLPGGETFVETIHPQRAVIIFGGGADAEPVAAIARAVGWRAELVTAKTCHPDAVKTSIDLTLFDAAVIMTHNFLHDVSILGAVMSSPISYVGLLGPKSRGQELLTQVEGVTAEMLERLHNPIGLDIGGESPEEIALAIVAEIQAALNGRDASGLRDRSGPIHQSASSERKTCA